MEDKNQNNTKDTNETDDDVRYDPKPGTYRAELVEISCDTDMKGRDRTRMKWKLLNYPDQESTYYVYGHFLAQHQGNLSLLFLRWQGKSWGTLQAEAKRGQPSPVDRFIGEQADIVVEGHVNKQGQARCHVAAVHPAGSYIEQAQGGEYRLIREADE